jgi:hypothetical protein
MSNKGKRHMGRVAEFGQSNGCIVCGEPYADVHHILEGRTPGRRSGDFCTIPLCKECHTGTHGIHGSRRRWSLHKAAEESELRYLLIKAWRSDTRNESACRGKSGFSTPEFARKVLHRSSDGHSGLTVYRCHVCRLWHIGHHQGNKHEGKRPVEGKVRYG